MWLQYQFGTKKKYINGFFTNPEPVQGKTGIDSNVRTPVAVVQNARFSYPSEMLWTPFLQDELPLARGQLRNAC